MLLAAVRTCTRPFLRRAIVSKSSFSAEAFQSQFVRQGGILNCDLTELPQCTVNITSKWQDHCEVSSSEEVEVELKITEFEESNQISIKGCSSAENANCTIDITIPEYMDINLDANHLHLNIVNKVGRFRYTVGYPMLIDKDPMHCSGARRCGHFLPGGQHRR